MMISKGIKFTVGKSELEYSIGRFIDDYYPNQPKEGMTIRWPVQDEDGKTSKASSVLDITLGGKQITHVGSSLIAYQDGLTNVLDKYPKRMNITNNDRSVPFMNRFVKGIRTTLRVQARSFLFVRKLVNQLPLLLVTQLATSQRRFLVARHF